MSQNSDDVSMAQVDGFIFDGPIASGQSNGQQKITTTSTTTTVASTILSETQYNACLDNCPVIIILLILKSM